MNIAIIGVGGVGGYFGGKLAKAFEKDKSVKIYFIARGKHLEAIKENGLILESDDGAFICKPTLATDNISDLPEIDLFLICVKSYDLKKAAFDLKDKISDKTMILPLLNGADIYERIRKVINNGIVFPACVYVGTHIENPGKIKQKGGSRTIHFGNDPNDDFVDENIFEIFQKANIMYNWNEKPFVEIWSKYIFIASFGLVTAAFDKTLGEVLDSYELRKNVENIMKEIYQISEKKEIGLPVTIVEESLKKGEKFPFETKTSFQRDYEIADKPDERELLGETVIRMGKELGVKIETTEKIYDIIQKTKK